MILGSSLLHLMKVFVEMVFENLKLMNQCALFLLSIYSIATLKLHESSINPKMIKKGHKKLLLISLRHMAHVLYQ